LTVADLAHRYLWKADVVDRLLADENVHYDAENEQIVTDATLWALTDHQNSVRDLAKYDAVLGNTTVVDHIVYGAFGKVVSESDSSKGCLIKFTGRATDTLTGIEFHDKRVKNAGEQTWLSEDPISFTAGDPNVSRYCGNDPVNHTDPSGLQELAIPIITGGGAAGAVGTLAASPAVPVVAAAAAAPVVAVGGYKIGETISNYTLIPIIEWLFAPPLYVNKQTVREVLKRKKGSIMQAPLPKGSPSWKEIMNMTMEEIEKAAKAGKEGFKTIKKLLTDSRFDK
jgi:RHS repeat-associated protein